MRGLAIPPAWEEVWICPDPQGHLQATGIDAAGRKQYLYHPAWREHRDREKFERMARFAKRLPRLRRATAADLRAGELGYQRVLACAARLLDVGMFRIGGARYADDDGGIGLATIRREHVSLRGQTARKHSIDRAVCAVAELLGNTPAVARRSYIDPRVLHRYLSGWTIAAELERLPSLDPTDDRIRARIERAVLDLLADKSSSSRPR